MSEIVLGLDGLAADAPARRMIQNLVTNDRSFAIRLRSRLKRLNESVAKDFVFHAGPTARELEIADHQFNLAEALTTRLYQGPVLQTLPQFNAQNAEQMISEVETYAKVASEAIPAVNTIGQKHRARLERANDLVVGARARLRVL